MPSLPKVKVDDANEDSFSNKLSSNDSQNEENENPAMGDNPVTPCLPKVQVDEAEDNEGTERNSAMEDNLAFSSLPKVKEEEEEGGNLKEGSTSLTPDSERASFGQCGSSRSGTESTTPRSSITARPSIFRSPMLARTASHFKQGVVASAQSLYESTAEAGGNLKSNVMLMKDSLSFIAKKGRKITLSKSLLSLAGKLDKRKGSSQSLYVF